MIKILLAFKEGLRVAFKSLFSHGLRSALTTLGIIIGVCAVIIVVSIMEGLSANISSQLDDLGSDMITLSAYTNTEQEMLGSKNKLTYDDFSMLKSRVSTVQNMTVKLKDFSLGGTVNYSSKSVETQIIGTDSSYQNVVNIYPELGRFLTESDDDRRTRVAFIGRSLLNKLEIKGNPIGEFIRLNGVWFRVIGVAEEKGSIFGLDQDNYLIAPYSTIRSLNEKQATDNIDILFTPINGENHKVVIGSMKRLLRLKHKITNGDSDYFEFKTAEQTREKFDNITNSVTFVAAGVVAISLLVGGIGVMNIMLVSVTERTKEIGIAKALGATPQFILFQFLVESLVLSLFGGFVGLLLGYGVSTLLSLTIPGLTEISVPMWAVLLSFGFTSVIGVVFGLAPAIKASKLHPVDALRYES